MSCSLISMTDVGPKYPHASNTQTSPCRQELQCLCGPNTDHPNRSYTIGCWGQEGDTVTRWLQDVEFCYECESEEGCIFTYCEIRIMDMGITVDVHPCDALDGNDCKCPQYPNLEIVNSPCE